MTDTKPLVDRDYLLEKSPGMGGWTYTFIPEIAPDPHAHFGWVRVRGTIDGVPISDYHLMPGLHGSGQLFLSVKAALRKKIGKEAGDTVRIVLWRDDSPCEVPADFSLCLDDEPGARRFFDSLTDDERRKYVRWIEASTTERGRIERIARAVTALADGRKFTAK